MKKLAVIIACACLALLFSCAPAQEQSSSETEVAEETATEIPLGDM